MNSTTARARILLVDIGNTRVKWAPLDGGRLGRQQAAPHAGWSRADFARLFKGRGRFERIVAVSVAGPRIDKLFTAAARERTGLVPEFFVSKRRVAGMTTMYVEPWRLGADRFVAAIGAHRLARKRPVCVVGIGTALTLDLVDEAGRHLGGAIVPAPGLMKDSLLSKTSGIRRRAQGGSAAAAFFARSTRAAIEHGSRYAAAAIIDRAVDEARQILGRRPLVVLTGGGAAPLRALIHSAHEFVPDLVLRGLAVVASESAGS